MSDVPRQNEMDEIYPDAPKSFWKAYRELFFSGIFRNFESQITLKSFLKNFNMSIFSVLTLWGRRFHEILILESSSCSIWLALSPIARFTEFGVAKAFEILNLSKFWTPKIDLKSVTRNFFLRFFWILGKNLL